MAKTGKRGNPIVLSDEQIAQVEALASVLSLERIAQYFGVHPNTFAAIRKRQPEVDRRYQMGRSAAIKGVADALLTAALQGCRTAQIFYLKTQAGWREVERTAAQPPEHDRLPCDLEVLDATRRQIGIIY